MLSQMLKYIYITQVKNCKNESVEFWYPWLHVLYLIRVVTIHAIRDNYCIYSRTC